MAELTQDEQLVLAGLDGGDELGFDVADGHIPFGSGYSPAPLH